MAKDLAHTVRRQRLRCASVRLRVFDPAPARRNLQRTGATQTDRASPRRATPLGALLEQALLVQCHLEWSCQRSSLSQRNTRRLPYKPLVCLAETPYSGCPFKIRCCWHLYGTERALGENVTAERSSPSCGSNDRDDPAETPSIRLKTAVGI